jgi:4-amino-4-deoxy-L-arabinose transferase-like glycosyltransferase
MGGRRFWAALACIAVVAFAGRAVYVDTVTQHDMSIDEAYYAISAKSLADGDGFRFRPLPGAAKQENASHPPLPTAVLASVARFTHSNDLAMRLLVAFAGAGVVAVVGLIGRHIAGARVGLITAGVAAIYPNLWMNDGLLMAETFATLCSAGVVLFTYRLLRAPNWKNAAGAGVLCGLAMLARAELALLLVLLLVPVVLGIREITRRRRLRLAAVAVVVAVIPAVPWIGYNLTRFDKPVYLSYGAGSVFAGANCDQTYSGPLLGYWYGWCTTTPPGDASVVEVARREKGLDYVRDHLGRLPVVVAAREGRIWGVYQPFQMADFSEGEGRPRWASLTGWAMFWPLVALGISGGALLRRRGVRLLPLIAPLVVVTLTAAAFYGLLRFRAPAEVSLVVLGGVGADTVLSRVPWFHHGDSAETSVPPAIAYSAEA